MSDGFITFLVSMFFCPLCAVALFSTVRRDEKIRRGRRLLAVLENFRTGKGKPCCLCKHTDEPNNDEYASCVLTKTEVFDKFDGVVRCSMKWVQAERKEHGSCGPDGNLFELRKMTDFELECIALAQKSGQPKLKQGC